MGNYLIMQICNTCSVEKPFSLFAIHSNGKPRKQCRTCKKNGNRKDPKRIAKQKEWLKTHYYEKALQHSRNWRKNNLQYDAFRAATYRAIKNNQTPPWSDLDKIKDFYLNCPKGYHVDHIVPLRGKLVSGLHTIENLQYLPAKENLAKRNIYDVQG